ncbi:MAG: DegT/DnrJ/EryC1/StrS family aminotransferase [Spirochaetia bacterium]
MIPLYKPTIKRKDMDSVLTCMVSDRIDHGKITEDFVSELGTYLGSRGGAAFRDFGRAVETVLREMGLEKGAGISISPLAPRIYWEVFRDFGIQPVLHDVDSGNGCLLPETLSQAKGEPSDAIIVTYPLGYVPDLSGIAELGIPLIEDISEGLGSNDGEKKAGSYGNYILVGLEADHIITAGGGCAVFSDSRKGGAALKRLAGTYPKEFLLPDMNSSLGIIQVKEVEKYVARRSEIAGIYSRSLMRSRHKMLTQRGDAENVFYTFPVFLETGMKEVSAYARKKGIETAPAFSGTIIEYLQENPVEEYDVKAFPNALNLYLRTLAFPLYPMLGVKDIEQTGKVLSSLP